MTHVEERVLVYTAVALLCAFVGTLAGWGSSVATFLQIAAVIEGVFWFGLPRARVYRLRQQRILFNR